MEAPKGTYATTSALINANPDTGVYIVTADGHIYSWTKNGGTAVDLGVYQSTGIADGSISLNKINLESYNSTDNNSYLKRLIFDKLITKINNLGIQHTNMFDVSDITSGKQLLGSVGTHKITEMTDNANAYVYNKTIEVKQNDVIYGSTGYVNYYIYDETGLLVQTLGGADRNYTITNANAKYLRMWCSDNLQPKYTTEFMFAINRELPLEYVSYNKLTGDFYDLGEVTEKMNSLGIERINLFDWNDVTLNKVMGGTVGTHRMNSYINQQGAYVYNKILEVKQGDVIYCSTGYVSFFIYDETGLLVQYLGGADKSYTITHANAKYLRMSCANNSQARYTTDLMFSINIQLPNSYFSYNDINLKI